MGAGAAEDVVFAVLYCHCLNKTVKETLHDQAL
jgi:hypothetical protein